MLTFLKKGDFSIELLGVEGGIFLLISFLGLL